MMSDEVRNPFHEMDVPGPDDAEVQAFAAGATLSGDAEDANASRWSSAAADDRQQGIEGYWCSRWNGGADPAIPGDAVEKWKRGRAEARAVEDRVYLLFDWGDGARKGLIETRRDGARLVGKYINLSNPAIVRPWIGLIISHERIDGRWSGGRLDFRR